MGKAIVEVSRVAAHSLCRQRIPAIIRWTCPECGEECELDLREHGLLKNVLCGDELIEEKIKLWCHVCDYTAMVRGAIRVTLELTNDEVVEYE